MIQDAIAQIVERKDLEEEVARQVMREMMAGNATPSQIGSFLTAMRMKGETESELRGFVVAMRESALRIESPPGAVDMCGTGGDGANTFNISTVSSFVVAGAGVPVAKHGNRSVSSRCGSADLLAALGIVHDLPPALAQECLGSSGMCFMFAPVFHTSMMNVIGPRREVGLRTFFNILGPMTNPAGVRNQLIGVYDPSVAMMMARVLRDLGTERALIVSGSGLDECSNTGRTSVVDLRSGRISDYEIEPGMFGLDLAEPREIRGGDPADNARVALSILKGERSPRADVVALNAAAGIYAAGRAGTIQEGLDMARDALASGRALGSAKRFASVSWELEGRRQQEATVNSLSGRTLHPDTLKGRAKELCEQLVSQVSMSDAGRESLDALDGDLLARPNILSVITLRRILSVAAAPDAHTLAYELPRQKLSDTISSSHGIAVIAEYKARSPSTGPLSVPPDPSEAALAYSSSGVAGVSVVAEPDFFAGSAELFARMRSKISLPMLYKDFVVSEAQLMAADHLGASAVLLIVKSLTPESLDRLIGRCGSFGMQPLIEVHDVHDLQKLESCPKYRDVRMVGVNSRDLRTLQTDLSGLRDLRERIGKDKLVVAESGVRTSADIRMISGFDAVLVGSAFMQAEDLRAKLNELVAECRSVG